MPEQVFSNTSRGPRISRTAGTPKLAAAVKEFHAAVARLRDLDTTTKELVRLRSAQVHDCRTCRAGREIDAVEAGVDQSMTAKVERYERSDLPERHKAALRTVDWLITRPDPADEAVIVPARAELGDAELADLVLNVSKNSFQKVSVSLGLDAIDPAVLNADGVAFYHYRDDGTRTDFSPEAEDAARARAQH